MGVQRHPGDSVGSPSERRPSARNLVGGFTLLESLVAIFIFGVTVAGIIGHGRVCADLIASTEADDRVNGIAQPAGDRVVVTVTEAGSGAGAPPCDVRLESIEDVMGAMQAEVAVTRRTP